MVTEGSERAQQATGTPAALAVLILGLAAMQITAPLTARLGLRVMLLLSETALVLPGLLLLLARRRPLGASLALTLPSTRVSLYALGLGATLWVASVGLLGLQALIWPPDPAYIEIFRKLLETLRPKGPLDALLSVAAIAVVPALCEETLLRGILLPPLARRMGALPGILISALLFAAIHLDLYRFPFTFAMGLALGILRLRTGSLTPGVLCHSLLNSITFAAAPFIDDPSGQGSDPSLLEALALLAVGSSLSILILRALGSPAEKR